MREKYIKERQNLDMLLLDLLFEEGCTDIKESVEYLKKSKKLIDYWYNKSNTKQTIWTLFIDILTNKKCDIPEKEQIERFKSNVKKTNN